MVAFNSFIGEVKPDMNFALIKCTLGPCVWRLDCDTSGPHHTVTVNFGCWARIAHCKFRFLRNHDHHHALKLCDPKVSCYPMDWTREKTFACCQDMARLQGGDPVNQMLVIEVKRMDKLLAGPGCTTITECQACFDDGNDEDGEECGEIPVCAAVCGTWKEEHGSCVTKNDEEAQLLIEFHNKSLSDFVEQTFTPPPPAATAAATATTAKSNTRPCKSLAIALKKWEDLKRCVPQDPPMRPSGRRT
jgi:hypothetical protein